MRLTRIWWLPLAFVIPVLAAAQSGADRLNASDIFDRPIAPTLAASAENRARINELAKQMRQEMRELSETGDVQVRAKLLGSHRAHLHEMMMLMRREGGDSMDRLLKGHLEHASPDEAAGGGRADGMQPAETDARLANIEARLEMLQTMVEALLEHMTMQGLDRQGVDR